MQRKKKEYECQGAVTPVAADNNINNAAAAGAPDGSLVPDNQSINNNCLKVAFILNPQNVN